MAGRLLSALLLALLCHALVLRAPLPERRPPQIGGAQQRITLQLTAAPAATMVSDVADTVAPAEPLPPPTLPAPTLSPPGEEVPPEEPATVVPDIATLPEPIGQPPPAPVPAPDQLRTDGQKKRYLPIPPTATAPALRTPPPPAPQPASQSTPQPASKASPQSVSQSAPRHPPQVPSGGSMAAVRQPLVEENSAPAIIQARPAYRTNPKPPYPELARRRNWQGTVSLAVTVDSDGIPTEVLVDTGSGYALLDRAAMQAVRAWRFQPGSENGRPVTMTVLVPIHFRLE